MNIQIIFCREKDTETSSTTLTPIMLNDSSNRQNSVLEAAATEINVEVQKSSSSDLFDLLESIE